MVRRGALVMAVATTVALAAPAAASAAQGYVLANDPTAASYTPTAAYRFNSTGAANTITRQGVGHYTVTFPGLADPTRGGTVNVTAYGNAPNSCQVQSWTQQSGAIVALVLCFSPIGAFADSQFTASYTGPPHETRFAYLWSGNPSPPIGTLSPAPAMWSYNSAAPQTLIRRVGVGQYRVVLPGVTAIDGTVKVTPYGPQYRQCALNQWFVVGGGLEIPVTCTVVGGFLADGAFTLTFAGNRNLLGTSKRFGYTLADLPTSAGPYSPLSAYSGQKPAGAISIRRFGTGDYEVFFARVGTGRKATVQVTPYASTAECRVGSWAARNDGQAVSVRCTFRGTPVDSQFIVQLAR